MQSAPLLAPLLFLMLVRLDIKAMGGMRHWESVLAVREDRYAPSPPQ